MCMINAYIHICMYIYELCPCAIGNIPFYDMYMRWHHKHIQTIFTLYVYNHLIHFNETLWLMVCREKINYHLGLIKHLKLNWKFSMQLWINNIGMYIYSYTSVAVTVLGCVYRIIYS